MPFGDSWCQHKASGERRRKTGWEATVQACTTSASFPAYPKEVLKLLTSPVQPAALISSDRTVATKGCPPTPALILQTEPPQPPEAHWPRCPPPVGTDSDSTCVSLVQMEPQAQSVPGPSARNSRLYVLENGLDLLILLSLPPGCWDRRPIGHACFTQSWDETQGFLRLGERASA